MGISLFPRKKKAESEAPQEPAAAAAPAPKADDDGIERMTANEWAKKLNFNEVAAERAAMRAGKWYARFTEEEFLELIRKSDV